MSARSPSHEVKRGARDRLVPVPALRLALGLGLNLGAGVRVRLVGRRRLERVGGGGVGRRAGAYRLADGGFASGGVSARS